MNFLTFFLANTWKITLNKFPYFYEDDVTNYVLWYENKDATIIEKQKWVSECGELKNYDLLVFENPECIKSIKMIPHLQILARKSECETPKTIFGYKFDSNEKFKFWFKLGSFVLLLFVVLFLIVLYFA